MRLARVAAGTAAVSSVVAFAVVAAVAIGGSGGTGGGGGSGSVAAFNTCRRVKPCTLSTFPVLSARKVDRVEKPRCQSSLTRKCHVAAAGTVAAATCVPPSISAAIGTANSSSSSGVHVDAGVADERRACRRNAPGLQPGEQLREAAIGVGRQILERHAGGIAQ